VVNGYGPTENTTFSACLIIEREYADKIPVGRPISGSTAYIMDRLGKVQPVGVVGEIWVGGLGLARGYLNNPELTAEKFVGGLYKTGDLGRWLPDGTIEFLGRSDFQVKIRGFRIELAEIENQLLKHPDVNEAVVLARDGDNKEKYLCAYLVGKRVIDMQFMREFLSKKLPDAMIPAYFVFLEQMPLNANGKVDRRALPDPLIAGDEREYVAPVDEIETGLVEIWAGLFGLEASVIGTDRNFFDLGGHSLKATLMIARIHKRFGVEIPLSDFFSMSPTVQEIASFIRAMSWMSYRDNSQAVKQEIFL